MFGRYKHRSLDVPKLGVLKSDALVFWSDPASEAISYPISQGLCNLMGDIFAASGIEPIGLELPLLTRSFSGVVVTAGKAELDLVNPKDLPEYTPEALGKTVTEKIERGLFFMNRCYERGLFAIPQVNRLSDVMLDSLSNVVSEETLVREVFHLNLDTGFEGTLQHVREQIPATTSEE